MHTHETCHHITLTYDRQQAYSVDTGLFRCVYELHDAVLLIFVCAVHSILTSPVHSEVDRLMKQVAALPKDADGSVVKDSVRDQTAQSNTPPVCDTMSAWHRFF